MAGLQRIGSTIVLKQLTVPKSWSSRLCSQQHPDCAPDTFAMTYQTRILRTYYPETVPAVVAELKRDFMSARKSRLLLARKPGE